MIGPSDVPTASPLLLIDEWEEECVENTAWVEKTEKCDEPEKAVAVIESEYPVEDRTEEEVYRATGGTVWLKPEDGSHWAAHHEGAWTDAEPGEPGALEFWVVVVVCLA